MGIGNLLIRSNRGLSGLGRNEHACMVKCAHTHGGCGHASMIFPLEISVVHARIRTNTHYAPPAHVADVPFYVTHACVLCLVSPPSTILLSPFGSTFPLIRQLNIRFFFLSTCNSQSCHQPRYVILLLELRSIVVL